MMASGPSFTASISDPLNKPSFSEAPQQENGDSQPPKSTEDSTVTEPTETKAPENPAPANGVSSKPVSETKQEETNTGEKRDLEATSTAKPSADESAEPDSKKQKTGEDNADAANGTSAPAPPEKKAEPAPPKKKGGRPKKTQDSVKKDIPTDGIGSRTRSRTKPSS